MSERAQKYLQILKRKPVEPAQAAEPDERDVAIERLERAVEEEREHAATLRKTVDELRFQIKTLETSYATQLAEARQRHARDEQAIAEAKAATAGAHGERDDLQQALEEAQARIERLSAGADLMASMDTPPGIAAHAADDALSIDEILADQGPAAEEPKADAEPAELEEPLEDMLSPELVLSRKSEA